MSQRVRSGVAGAGALLLLCGCGKPPAAPPPAPGVGQTWRLSQAVPLETVPVPTRARIAVSFHLAPPVVESPVLFGTLRATGGGIEEALILGRTGAQWRGIELKSLPGYEWVHASCSPARREIFGVLDLLSEPRATALLLVRSEDAGRTWTTLASIDKPHVLASFASLTMGGDGKGRLSMVLDSDQGGAKQGLHHFRTADGGRTWGSGEHEADTLASAAVIAPPAPGRSLEQLESLMRMGGEP